MSANLKEPFGPSCCDGGANTNTQSAQPCGCDPGAQWICQRHNEFQQWGAPGLISNPIELQESTPPPTRATTLPTGSADRKTYPIASGVLDYFPDALIAIAHVSYVGNDQHNPGQPLHWAREKSIDQDDTLMRHFLERGKLDTDGLRHSAKMAWRALALLQLEIEAERK